MNLPAMALLYLPLLVSEVDQSWRDMPDRPVLAAQVEQETCPSLSSKKCWNPKAELKTSREYGFGLGQLTVTSKFDNFKAAKTWDKALADWEWSDRFNPAYQLRALVVYDRNLYRQIRFGKTVNDRLAFMLSAYNGGFGGVIKDRRLCAASEKCDPDRWFGHVESTSFRAKTSVSGYGKSFFEINREYVRNILTVRRDRYVEAMRK